ncbi:class I SAM-dependent methyltransferase [Salsipaludibacter albus]|uniref:class I SAM-dependent methyltransferase n=1 Tax=Salsipaludibacter albus TaxID=2849650 RepID=UPI001EE4CE80|nr:class I SAM-dependent methyltransferase [Salsipaludibacter albus]
MSETTSGIRSVLSLPAVYELAQRAIGARRGRDRFVAQYVRPESGMRVLDIGCGPGTILDHLPPTDYLGFDISEAYVQAARERFGARATFQACGIDDFDPAALGDEPVDRVLSRGVLHHVDDRTADALFALAARVSGPGTVVITMDPTLHAGQHPVAAWLAHRDRGEAVRRPEEYAAFARTHFAEVDLHLHTDLLRVPYSHAVVVARGPRG